MTHIGRIETAIREATDKSLDIWLENVRLTDVFHTKATRAPLEVWAFLGEPYAGKTKTANETAKLLSAEEDILKYDMATFTKPYELALLIGKPFGRKDTSYTSLADVLESNSNRTIILDNFDKAHPEVQNLFRDAIRDGALMNSLGQKIPMVGTNLFITADTDRKGFIALMRDDKNKRLRAPYKIVTVKKEKPVERYKHRQIKVNGHALTAGKIFGK